ncbi:hypothetical protein [Paenalcaligenes suwonensis]|uniref:hypothetical protein n=1 Tax=Paenalcaligenes suwonensis TaxID=1202713 RepID=UPI001F625CE7|nr:hypothetical protein [Paenalcaligenes suwonensis]
MHDNESSVKRPSDYMERSPRAFSSEQRSLAMLYSEKSLGCNAIVAVVCRNTRGAMLSDAQRLSHFPASPLVCLSWHDSSGVGAIDRQQKPPLWKPFAESILISGSQSMPTVSWSPQAGRVGMVFFTVSAAQELFNIDITAIQDRSVCARQLLGAT